MARFQSTSAVPPHPSVWDAKQLDRYQAARPVFQEATREALEPVWDFLEAGDEKQTWTPETCLEFGAARGETWKCFRPQLIGQMLHTDVTDVHFNEHPAPADCKRTLDVLRMKETLGFNKLNQDPNFKDLDLNAKKLSGMSASDLFHLTRENPALMSEIIGTHPWVVNNHINVDLQEMANKAFLENAAKAGLCAVTLNIR